MIGRGDRVELTPKGRAAVAKWDGVERRGPRSCLTHEDRRVCGCGEDAVTPEGTCWHCHTELAAYAAGKRIR